MKLLANLKKAAFFSCLAIAPTYEALSCTRALWNDNDLGVFVGRTMDWAVSTDPEIIFFPSGLERNGSLLAGQPIDPANNPMVWKSKYASLITSTYNAGSVDGLNQEGLAVHLLFLVEADFGERNKNIKGVHAGLWGQYILDNASNVEEAIALMNDIQLIMVEHLGFSSKFHLAMEDESGDSAIIEYINGQPKIHHGREYQVLTNDPEYDKHLAYLNNFCTRDETSPEGTPCFDGATRNTDLPGNANPQHRFVRATYFLEKLEKPQSNNEAIASIMSVARNTSVPFGAPNSTPTNVYNTEYRTAIDFTNKKYYFDLTKAPNVFWISINDFFDSEATAFGTKPMKLSKEKIYSLTLHGNVMDSFEELDQVPF